MDVMATMGNLEDGGLMLRMGKQEDREAWVSNDTYWELRKDPGFSKVDSPVLW